MRTAQTEFEEATLGTAAIRGWLMGVLIGMGVIAAFTIGEIVLGMLLSPPDWPLLAVQLPAVAIGLFLLSVACGIIALPSAGIFWAVLLIAERTSRQLLSLPVWLTAGLAAASPSAALIWYLQLALIGFADSDGSAPDPLSWDAIQLPLLALGCGLIGALFAWRARRAELTA